VYGEGSPTARLMIIGEGPGADEDASGRPFVGPAGQLLTRMLAAIHIERDDVYIGNIVKCRPPNNRDPLPTEVQACLPYLEEQIELIHPAYYCCWGAWPPARC
jgi:DNA polymerase